MVPSLPAACARAYACVCVCVCVCAQMCVMNHEIQPGDIDLFVCGRFIKCGPYSILPSSAKHLRVRKPSYSDDIGRSLLVI